MIVLHRNEYPEHLSNQVLRDDLKQASIWEYEPLHTTRMQ